MKLLTKDLVKTLPVLYSQEDTLTRWWCVNSLSRTQVGRGMPSKAHRSMRTGTMTRTRRKWTLSSLVWCPVLEVELGYFSLSELKGIRGKYGLPVERDRFFEPTRLSAVKTLCKYNR